MFSSDKRQGEARNDGLPLEDEVFPSGEELLGWKKASGFKNLDPLTDT